MNSPESPSVHHDAAARRFEIVCEGHRSELDYAITDGRIVFTHTFVPPELRGRGLAEHLVRAGLAWARGEGKPVVPACSYVDVFIQRHPEFQSLLGRP